MSKKLKKRVNGGLAIYFGIGSLFGAVICLVGFFVLVYQAIFLENNITWDIFLIPIIGLIVSGLTAYALLRVGYDEIEN